MFYEVRANRKVISLFQGKIAAYLKNVFNMNFNFNLYLQEKNFDTTTTNFISISDRNFRNRPYITIAPVSDWIEFHAEWKSKQK